MKHKTIVTTLLTLVAMTGQAQSRQLLEQKSDIKVNWILEGTVDNAEPTDTLFVFDLEEQRDIATIQVKDSRIVATGGTLTTPAVCGIVTKDRSHWITAFVLENGTVNIHVDVKKNFMQHIGGTPINDEMNAVLTEEKQNTSDPTLFSQRIYKVVNGIVEKHPDHIVSSFLIDWCKSCYTPTQSLGLIDKLSHKLQESLKIDRLKDNLTLQQETEVGKRFKELTGISPDKKSATLSAYVGRGNYVLVDFWASWCGPCKAEMPHIIDLYEKYKNIGLKVIGITVDDMPEKSDSIVKLLGIPFPQIYKSTPMSTYGITSIPHTILFAPDGTILARGLRVEDIEKKLDEIFKSNK
jgi:thiol-disulfide isomerase/thioredoxin